MQNAFVLVLANAILAAAPPPAGPAFSLEGVRPITPDGPPFSARGADSYLIEPPDVLHIHAIRMQLRPGNHQPTGVEGDHLVRPDGTISLGRYGCVYVAGFTREQARRVIELYLLQYMIEPKISVEVAAANSAQLRRFTQEHEKVLPPPLPLGIGPVETNFQVTVVSTSGIVTRPPSPHATPLPERLGHALKAAWTTFWDQLEADPARQYSDGLGTTTFFTTGR